MALPLCPSAQLLASTLIESEPAFLMDGEGNVLYENPAGKKLIFQTTEQQVSYLHVLYDL